MSQKDKRTEEERWRRFVWEPGDVKIIGYDPPTTLAYEELIQLWKDIMQDRPPSIAGPEGRRMYDKMKLDIDAKKRAGYIVDVPSDLPPIEEGGWRIPDPDFPAQRHSEPGTFYYGCVHEGVLEEVYRIVNTETRTNMQRLTVNGWVDDTEGLMEYFLGREYGLRELVDVTDADIATWQARGLG